MTTPLLPGQERRGAGSTARGAMVALSGVWLFVLLASGAIEHEVLVLHLFQSLIYVAVIVLALRGSKWACGIAISIAVMWNYFNLHTGFVFDAGFRVWRQFLSGGGIRNFVQFLAPIAWFAHVGLIAAALASYARRSDRRWADTGVLVASFAGTFAYFAAILALFGPQFLPRLLHLFGIRH